MAGPRSQLESPASLDEDYNDRSSTSTAGPPPDLVQNTGRFGRPSWAFATARQYNSSASSVTSSCRTGGDRTGSFPGAPRSNRTGSRTGHHSRTMSSNSVSVSPMGSSSPQQEWGRSFRLFSTTRHLSSTSTSRQRDGGGGSNNVYRSALRNHMQGRPSITGIDNEYSANYTGGSSFHYQRQSSLFSGQSGVGGFGAGPSTSPEMRSSIMFSIGSPLIGAFPNVPSSSMFTIHYTWSHGAPRTASSLARFLLGGGADVFESLSPAQKELPLLLNALRTNLALNGTTIIVGDKQHALEVKRGALIAAGGFSKVYAGLNTVKGELVAIKEISIDDVDDFKVLQAVEQEFALLRSLRHPNIVRYSFFEHSRSQKVCRIVMELLAGDSTLNLLHKYGPLTEVILRKLARHLLSAIAFIHKEGIFHRDIKPANILVNHRGEVKLCDFGCSKRVTELSKASSCIIGTPAYMAPELIRGETNHKADIWSTACTLFELATGMLPWYHSGVRDHLPLMFYITTTSETPLVLPVHDNAKEFSPEFMNFMELCFTRDVRSRPEASELLKHPWLNGRRLAASPMPCSMSCTSLQGQGNPTTGTPLAATADAVQAVALQSPESKTAPGGGGGTPSLMLDRNERLSNGTDSATCTPPSSSPLHVDDESVCQQELEEVAAAIAIDLCNTLMNAHDPIARNWERRFVDAGSNNHNGTTAMSDTSTSTLSPSLGQRRTTSTSIGDFFSPSTSPEHSILHDNFYYTQIPLGASAGNFVLPTDLPEAPLQQYLRINESGNLDFATLPDEDSEGQSDATVRRQQSVDSGMFALSYSNRMLLSPARSNSFTPGNLMPSSANVANATPNGCFPSPNSPIGLATGSGSRSESPYRHSVVLSVPPSAPAVCHRPTPPSSSYGNAAFHSVHQLQQHRKNSSPQPASHESSVREDERTPVSPLSVSTQHSSSVKHMQQRPKPQADGKLHMSFVVNTAPGQEVNVKLDVDVNDVHCRMVDNRPNYLVAMTDGIREQITSKIKEVSAQSAAASPVRSPLGHSMRAGGSGVSSCVSPAGDPPLSLHTGRNYRGHTPPFRSSQMPASHLSFVSLSQSPGESADGGPPPPSLLAATASSSTSRASTPALSSPAGGQQATTSILTPRISPHKGVKKQK